MASRFVGVVASNRLLSTLGTYDFFGKSLPGILFLFLLSLLLPRKRLKVILGNTPELGSVLGLVLGALLLGFVVGEVLHTIAMGTHRSIYGIGYRAYHVACKASERWDFREPSSGPLERLWLPVKRVFKPHRRVFDAEWEERHGGGAEEGEEGPQDEEAEEEEAIPDEPAGDERAPVVEATVDANDDAAEAVVGGRTGDEQDTPTARARVDGTDDGAEQVDGFAETVVGDTAEAVARTNGTDGAPRIEAVATTSPTGPNDAQPGRPPGRGNPENQPPLERDEELYRRVMSVLSVADTSRAGEFQGTFTFCRSMEVGLALALVAYIVVLRTDFLPEAIYQNSAPVVAAFDGALLYLIVGLLGLITIFAYGVQKYKKHFVKYAITDFETACCLEPDLRLD